MSALYIDVEVHAGSNITESVIPGMVGLANRLLIDVWASLNGVRTLARPGDDPAAIIAAWETESTSTREYRTASASKGASHDCYADLMKRLEAVAAHDWRTSILAHTPDTAAEAKAVIEAQAARVAKANQLLFDVSIERDAAEARIAELERERHIWEETAELARESCDSYWAEAAKLRADRDELREGVAHLYVERDQARDEAVEVVRPFVFGDAALEQILWGDKPDDENGTVTISLRDLRRARAFHTKHSGEKP